jgi:hypothetical protein
MAYFHNGKLIREGRSWTDSNGIQHPTNWSRWSDQEKQAAGLEWRDDPKPYDNRFYWDADTPKSIDDRAEVDENGDPVLDGKGNQVITLGLKSVWKRIVKQQAGDLLAETDWYITRKSETGQEVPDSVSEYRSAVRTAADRIESAIDSAKDHTEFVSLFITPLDENSVATGKPPIADWPEK